MFRFLGLLVLVLALVLAAAFAYLNPVPVELDLGFGKYELPLATAIVATLGIGWLVGAMSLLGPITRLMGEKRRLRKSVRLAEMELDNMRSLPIRDAG